MILDEAQQKGTGKWTSQNSFDLGAPIPTDQRRRRGASDLGAQGRARRREPCAAGPPASIAGDAQQLIDAARHALYASKITSYAQGMSLLRMASAEYQLRHRSG